MTDVTTWSDGENERAYGLLDTAMSQMERIP
jgi:hypothetical protein